MAEEKIDAAAENQYAQELAAEQNAARALETEQAEAGVAMQIAELQAQVQKITKEARLNYRGAYFILTATAAIIDLIGMTPLEPVCTILVLIYTPIRILVINHYTARGTMDTKLMNGLTSAGVGLIEAVPIVNALPLLTGFMFVAYAKKRAQTMTDSARIKALQKQITNLERSI